MKAIRIPVFVLAVLLAFSVCNAVHLPRRCALWQAELAEADRAAAMGDIGKLFPDNDDRYLGADSMELLREVSRRLAEAGYRLGNLDATIIAQRPKLAPYIAQMRRNIADALRTDIGNISVKATTEERLGFTGSGEGIAAHAVCLIE